MLKRLTKIKDLKASRTIDIEGIKTVCLMLGPYRNLTTLTASILFLHPHCQVLNHAGNRIFGDGRLDFIADYSQERFETFMKYAIHISRSGKRGYYGGSITKSHAFGKKHPMKEIAQSSGVELVKRDIESLFWKESLLTSNHIRENKTDLGAIFAVDARLRFLLPVRNPLDCAVSNLRTGHVSLFKGLDKHSRVEDVVDAILDEFLWVENLRKRYPDRFQVYFEYEMNEDTLGKLAAFLGLAALPEWRDSALGAFEIKKRYRHADELVAHYRRSVREKFAGEPEFAANLLRFFTTPDYEERNHEV